MGFGFTWAITLISMIRELLGAGTLFGCQVMWKSFTPWVSAILPPGAFIVMGILVGLMNMITRKTAKDADSH